MTDSFLLPLCAAALGVVTLSTLPALSAQLVQARHRAPRDNFYQDADGESTPDTMAAFSNKTPKLCLVVFTVVGFGLSLAVTTLSILHPLGDGLAWENWLSNGCWAALVLQAICINSQHSPVRSHDLGLWAFLSSLMTAIVTVAEASHVGNFASPTKDAQLIVRIVNALVMTPLLLSCITLPRRPEVLYKAAKVDNEWTCSVLSRYTWSWVSHVLKTAKRKSDLDPKDIPRPDHTIRAESLVDAWNKANYQGSLVQSLLKAYGARLAQQWLVILIRCIIGIGPFWTMLRLVQSLEDRDDGRAAPRELWGLVFLMGVFTLTEQWLDGWIVWFSITKLFAPVRGQLSALIFEKSLRRKIVKTAETTVDGGSAGGGEDVNKDQEDYGDDSVLKSKQAIVNLVGVDTKHVADFAMLQHFIASSIGKLLIYSGYLVKLIGWTPFGAGLLAWSFVLPVNAVAAKFYIQAETRLMKNRDNKLAVVNEALLGMRQIKFSALEIPWEKKILQMREIEISSLKSVFKADSVLFFSWVASPILLAATSLAVYAIINGYLAPSVAFVSIGIFKSLELSLSALPELLTGAIDTLVSVRRIDKYLKGPEMKKTLTKGHDVAIDDATIAWPVDDEVPEQERFILKNVSLSFPAGELSVISGKTGTGKSLLLHALLGESDLLKGTIFVPPTTSPLDRHDGKAHPGNWILPGAVAYVGQSPWLESASLRDNILFGLPFVKHRYDTVLDVCALKRDIEILTDGDQTELGANGINLSGGQKWRLTLARAIYSRAEILIMDDIFSAVDAHVGRHIFEKCIAGTICAGRTRILVTHHVALVEPATKYLVELGEGTVLHSGLTSDLAEDGILDLIKSHEQGQQKDIRPDDAIEEVTTAVNSEDHSVQEVGALGEGADTPHKIPSKTAKKFVEDEARAKGKVKAHVYGTFLSSSGGWFFWGICALLFVAFEAGNLGRNWWVRIWTGASEDTVTSDGAFFREHGLAYGLSYQHSTLHPAMVASRNPASSQSGHSLSYYLWVYIAIAVASGIVGVARFVWTFVMSIKAARTLFRRILFTIMRTRLRWLDTVPVGRVLNRLTADFDIIDNRITMDLGFMFRYVLGLLGVCVAALLVSSLMIPLALVLFAAGAYVATQYLVGARPVKRLESNAKSPVFELFNSSLAGVSTLRAFQKSHVYFEKMHNLLDSWDTMSVHNWTLNRWLGFRMALIGSVFTTVVGVIVVGSSFVDAGLAGFALSFALDFSGNMLMAIRGYASVELDMNAAERVIEYTEAETEDLHGEIPPAAWPATGNVEVKDLVVAYSDDLPPVLRGVSFDVRNNERIGVIGRTGAGKSSLTLALFRFLEARSGQIKIDGIDISRIRLHDLRSRLAIIPQDPVLFSGTIRTNLDPFDHHSDEELKDCLLRVHLVESEPSTPANEPSPAAAPKNTNIFRDLSSGVSESGGNLSQGQRQLLCIARAIVSRPKVMVLDEATSAVDMATDALIQRSIREQFTDSTLIVIAHRLSTIADFDRILVLSEGTIAEFGSPRELWGKEGGVFRDMCEHSGEIARLKEVILGTSK
ncbi:hypothetical protein E4U42_005318 [Claviceps africana]|uniref:Uncharacterized protein n=1 Tax=Claviceps africana TaxID=83212 RepID=A0A8K0JBU8_9HYPO|nr:hypothetical protein E4U42_005318 [Claviceps africana]